MQHFKKTPDPRPERYPETTTPPWNRQAGGCLFQAIGLIWILTIVGILGLS